MRNNLVLLIVKKEVPVIGEQDLKQYRYQYKIRCSRNSVNTEFSIFFELPQNPYAIRNWPKFRGITVRYATFPLVEIA
jgi:hypothetical protein